MRDWGGSLGGTPDTPSRASSSWECKEGLDTGSVIEEVDFGTLEVDVPLGCWDKKEKFITLYLLH